MGLQFLGIRVDRQERVLQGLQHVGDVRLLDELPDLRLRTLAFGEGGGEHQLAYEPRMLNRDLQCDSATVTKTKKIGTIDVKGIQQCRGVVSGLLETEWAVDVRGAPVSLLFERDDLPGASERRQDVTE